MFKERSTTGGRKSSIDGGEDGDEDVYEADDSLLGLLADDATASSMSTGDNRNVLNKGDLVCVTAAGGELENLRAHVISVDMSTQIVKVAPLKRFKIPQSELEFLTNELIKYVKQTR